MHIMFEYGDISVFSNLRIALHIL